MEKRSYDRIPAHLELHCFNTKYFGTVMDISEKGMFIKSQKIKFPLDLQFEISIPLKEDVLNVNVKINRVTKSNGYYDGIGVEILKHPYTYLKLIKSLKFALRNRKQFQYSIV